VIGTVLTIAANSFREAVRDRILYLLLAFAAIVIGVSRFVSLLTVGDEAKIVTDFGLSAISVFGVLTAMFVGVSLVFKEIERKTVYTLLASPVRRWQFVAGKYLGLLAVLAINGVAMAGVLALALAWIGGSAAGLGPAILLTFVQLALVAAFAILFSSYTNPILAAVGTAAMYVVGHLSWSFDLLKARASGALARAACDVLHAVLPNLDRLDVKAQAVHGVALPPGYVVAGVAYGLAYAAAVVVVACVVFERREFA
jgi:ABC-type transport system involved in multi-copper enzyme maturation permease subunit